MVALPQSSPGRRSARSLQNKTATVMLTCGRFATISSALCLLLGILYPPSALSQTLGRAVFKGQTTANFKLTNDLICQRLHAILDIVLLVSEVNWRSEAFTRRKRHEGGATSSASSQRRCGLDRLPISSFRWRILALFAGGLFFDAFDTYIAGSVLGSLVKEGTSNGELNATFIPTSTGGIGAAASGAIGDRLGRRYAYQTTLPIVGFTNHSRRLQDK
jgi:hypothetical protein